MKMATVTRYSTSCRATAPLQPRLLSMLIGGMFSGVLAAPTANAAATVASMTFDAGMFAAGGGSRADFSRFDKGNVVLPGSYRVDVIVNENGQGRRDITFSDLAGQDSAAPCFNRALLQQLGVDADKVARGSGGSGGEEAGGHPIPDGPLCGDLGDWVPGATASFDSAEQVLSVSIPQIFMNLSARGYVDPAQWDNGINAALLGYNFSSSTVTSGAGGSQAYLGLVGGVNAGAWRLRHQGSQAWSPARGRSSYQNTATYLQRSIAGLKSQLVIGDSFSSGQIMDSLRLRGVSLASDDRMLPQSQQGYAPVVRGIAEGNATVSISQNGYKIYETTVAPGPFVIDDLYPTGYGGDLTVTVTEAGGRKNTFVVPYAALPQLLRADTTKYSVAAGQLKQYGATDSAPFVMQAAIQHGVSNAVTLYGGATVSSGYAQAKLGTAFATPLGAISLDATASRTSVPGMGVLQGQSYGVAYNKNIPETGTNFALGAYRFSTDGYLSLPDAVNLRGLAGRGQDVGQYARQKSRLDVNLSQKLGDGTLSLYGSSVDYWGKRQGRQTSFTAGYGSRWKSVNWNLSVQRSRIAAAPLTAEQERQQQSDNIFFGPAYDSGRIDNRIVLTLTMPLGRSVNAPSMNTTLARNSGDSNGSDLNVGVSGTLGEERNVSYGASASRRSSSDSGSTGFNLYGGYQNSAAKLRAGYSQYGENGQLSFGADGGVVVHGGGVSLAQSLGDTVGLVHAPDAEGAGLTNVSNVRLDRRGYGVVPYLTPFQNNVIGIDPKGTSDHVELKESTQNVAPTLGAVSLLKFETVAGRAVVLKAMQQDGKPLPFAAEVFDEGGQAVGVVGQGSKAFVRGIADSGSLIVKWSEAAGGSCRIDYVLPTQAGRQIDAARVEGRCTPVRNGN
ncbi:MAG: htrE [Collimonas fungivorans]|uniref:fimbria/pilus outer membrane usher protein n=1 Tax=Collimonas fungivorans TaxID=158899 RepID=UPI0026F11D0F|nr:fimbria/pilus outer membrane usher protein [Collimonas fungivorans]MDB5768850.1 htrE [Collimonas fungivorans]